MPSVSKSQQRLFSMALAVRKGKLKRSEVNQKVLDIVDGDMTNGQIEHYTILKEQRSLKEFIKNLFDNTSENALVLFNLLGKNKEDVLRFIESINEPFGRKLVLDRDGKVCLLLIKSQKTDKVDAFINSLEKI
jgi:transcriptional regulator of NAD metabolism